MKKYKSASDSLRPGQLNRLVAKIKDKGDKITYDEWYENNEDRLYIECAESGADRELDFDFEKFCEAEYEKEKT